jgi:TonB family protein
MWARHRVAFIWLLVSLLAWAGPQAGNKQAETEKEAPEPVYELGEGITPPQLIRQVNPEYSGKKGVGVKGSVSISLVVNSKGLPENPKVVQGLDPDFDKSAVEAIKQWRFSPAQKDKKPVAVKLTVEVQFRSM